MRDAREMHRWQKSTPPRIPDNLEGGFAPFKVKITQAWLPKFNVETPRSMAATLARSTDRWLKVNDRVSRGQRPCRSKCWHLNSQVTRRKVSRESGFYGGDVRAHNKQLETILGYSKHHFCIFAKLLWIKKILIMIYPDLHTFKSLDWTTFLLI